MPKAHQKDRDIDNETTFEWLVSQCTCGEITLEFGAMSVRMTPRDLARLHRLTAAALERFQIEPSDDDVGHESDVVLH